MSTESHHEHHLMSLKVHFLVIGALFVLTFLTVLVSRFDFGVMNVFVALLIASIKAALVMGFFMHLKYDSLMNRVIFATSFIFLALLAIFSFLDLLTRVNPRA